MQWRLRRRLESAGSEPVAEKRNWPEQLGAVAGLDPTKEDFAGNIQ